MNGIKIYTYGFILLFMALITVFPVSAAESPLPAKTALVAVIPADFPPTYFRDKNGEPAGLAVDIKDAARKLHTPVIALTAYAMSGDHERFLCQGFDDYLAKPLQPGDLETAVADFVKNRLSV